MPLPKIATPTYDIELPSTKQEIKFRPFLVKEEKILVIALESRDNKQISNAIKSVLNNCVLTKAIKVEKLPTFDIEYLFLNIRGKSVGEEVEVNIICPDDEETSVTVKIELDEIKVIENSNHDKKIKLDENLIMELRYPSLDQFIKSNFDFNGETTDIENSFDLIASCIDKIYNQDECWASEDCTKKELIDFLEQMNSAQFKQIEKFFETMPKLSHKIEVVNPKTNVKSSVVLEGLTSFFA